MLQPEVNPEQDNTPAHPEVNPEQEKLMLHPAEGNPDFLKVRVPAQPEIDLAPLSEIRHQYTQG